MIRNKSAEISSQEGVVKQTSKRNKRISLQTSPTQLLHRRTSAIPRLPANKAQLQAPQGAIVRSRLSQRIHEPSRRGAAVSKPASRSQTTADVKTDKIQVQRSDPLLCLRQLVGPSQPDFREREPSLKHQKKLPYASSIPVVVRAGLRRSKMPGRSSGLISPSAAPNFSSMGRHRWVVRVVRARDVSAVVAHAYRTLCLTPKRWQSGWEWGSFARLQKSASVQRYL